MATLPVIKVEMNGEIVDMFFDTGAKISYVTPHLLRCEKERTEGKLAQDFHPSIGAFTTTVYKTEMTVGSKTFNMTCGTLPESLSYMVSMMPGVKGIIGSEVLDQCQEVFITSDCLFFLE